MASLPFLDKEITSSNGTSYERLDPITDFRQCHGVVPPERRILYCCRRLSSAAPATPNDGQEECIMKIKVQIPDCTDSNPVPDPQLSHPTHSAATAHELEALQIFGDAGTEYGPRLVAFETLHQGPDGLLPGGYISYTIMTTIPGKSLFDLGYWSLEPDDRAEIQQSFFEALAYVVDRRTHSLETNQADKVTTVQCES